MTYARWIVLSGSTLILSSCSGRAPAAADMAPPTLVAVHVDAAPTIDGDPSDPAWQQAVPLVVTTRLALDPDQSDRVDVELRAVYSETRIAFLVTWPDGTADTTHKTWTWNAADAKYVSGDDREDMFALVFAHTGVFDVDMLSGIEATWDVWHWKAARSNPQGYATDKTHVYTAAQPAGKAKSYPARNGGTIWIARPEDAGDGIQRKQPAPNAYQGDRVPQYLPGIPTDSAADVRAKGRWADGRWTLELSRALNTGHDDDTSFDTARSYPMAVAPFDRTGKMDKASGIIELVFGNAVIRETFENDTAGQAPTRFTASRTGRGAAGAWEVREEATAPSGAHVLAQTSADRTNYRFPVMTYDGLDAAAVDVSVRFRPLTGVVDQAAGLVWRFRDVDNYYVVRANALENNVVLYKVENGKRSDLPVKGTTRSYGVTAPVPSGEWSTLRATAVADHFEVYLNGRKLFEVEDATFAGPGRVGLWTKADSVTLFDDLALIVPHGG